MKIYHPVVDPENIMSVFLVVFVLTKKQANVDLKAKQLPFPYPLYSTLQKDEGAMSL